MTNETDNPQHKPAWPGDEASAPPRAAEGLEEVPLDLPMPLPPPRPSLWKRFLRSKRVRFFFVLSIVAHALFFTLLSSKLVYDYLIAQRDVPEVKATPWEIQQAIRTLETLYKGRFKQSLRELTDIRSTLNTLVESKQARMKAEDKDREQKIASGIWPTAEAPDRTAKYFPRIDTDLPRFALVPLPDTTNMDLAGLYRLHAPLEEQIGRIYERFHALDLSEALEDPIPLSQSVKNTRLALPKRRDIDADRLDPAARTGTAMQFLDGYKKELIDAYLETQDMLNTCRRWLELAQAKDLGSSALLASMFGTQYDVVPPPQPYYGHYLNPKLLRQVDLQPLIRPKVALGNRIGKGEVSEKADWVSLDRWYYIGPFQHPGAQRRMADLERKYPPENEVNLDAGYDYEGKDGRKLVWKYRHIGTDFIEGGLRFEPYTVDNGAYAIWYFYTVVWSDEDRTVLGSFASDDYGVCWVNDQRIYQSPPDTRPWVPFTRYGLRPVPLHKGFNRFLFKLENAVGTTGFSVILMTYEDKELLRAIQQEP